MDAIMIKQYMSLSIALLGIITINVFSNDSSIETIINQHQRFIAKIGSGDYSFQELSREDAKRIITEDKKIPCIVCPSNNTDETPILILNTNDPHVCKKLYIKDLKQHNQLLKESNDELLKKNAELSKSYYNLQVGTAALGFTCWGLFNLAFLLPTTCDFPDGRQNGTSNARK